MYMALSHATTWEEDIRTPLHETLLGYSREVVEARKLIERLAPVDLTVMVTGETGTGKDIVARMLHRLSPRYGKPFIKVNCPSIPEGILESELFGYEKGAFTGAHSAKPGRFELANDGTIFLDEISEVSLGIQGKLLQVLDSEPFLRIGGTEPIKTNARIVAATNVFLDDSMNSMRLRSDIAFRLKEVVVHIPPLRERKEDIPVLAEHFNYNICKVSRKPYIPLEKELIEELVKQSWPGNVRELAGRIKKYLATGSSDALLYAEGVGIQESRKSKVQEESESTKSNGHDRDRKFLSLKEAASRAAETAEKELIEEALRYTLWNRRKAAKLLSTSYSSLLRRIDAYGIGNSSDDR